MDSTEQKARSTFGNTVKVTREYISTTIAGFDYTIGGGLCPGRVILFGGFAGMGKTTLLTLVADGTAKTTKRKVIYASAEEGTDAVQEVVLRLNLVNDNVEIMGGLRSIEPVIERAKEIKAFLIIFDSAQKFVSDYAGGSSGSPSQCKAIGETIARYCQTTKTCAIIVNQMSGSGELRGGTELEHNCDTIMVLAPPQDEDEDAPDIDGKVRGLFVSKNRVGDENLRSYWKMQGKDDPHPGMIEHIPPRSKIIDLVRRRYPRREE